MLKEFIDKVTGKLTKREYPKELLNLVERFLQQAQQSDNYWEIKIKDFEAGRELLELEPGRKIDLVCFVLDEYVRAATNENKSGYAMVMNSANAHAMRLIFSQFMRRNLPFSKEDLIYLLQIANQSLNSSYGWLPQYSILGTIDRIYDEASLPKELEALIRDVVNIANSNTYMYEDLRKLKDRANFLLGDKQKETLTGDFNWSKEILKDLESLPTDKPESWSGIIEHALTANSSKPSKKWLKVAETNIKPIGEEDFSQYLTKWFSLVCKEKFDSCPLNNEVNSTILKGLVWYGSLLTNDEITDHIRQLGIYCFRKMPSIGAVSVKVGNACVYVLGQIPGLDSVSMLNEMLKKIKYPSARKLIEKALDSAAQRNGMTREDLDELSVPTYGFNNDGALREAMGEFTSVVSIGDDRKVSLLWEKQDGKTQKSVPVSIKESHKQEIKELKKIVKEAQSTLQTQAWRIEKLLLRPDSWSFSDWKSRYIDHPLLAQLTHKLIWSFREGDNYETAIWRGGKLIGADEHELNVDEERVQVNLWHPVSSASEEVHAWREYLYKHEITQPFKQSHREVYILTDAERQTDSYSNRFAAHILKQHQMNALCQQRGWSYSLQGQFDSWNPAIISLEKWDINAEFNVDAVDADATEMGIYQYVSTDQVRFYLDGQTLSLVNVPLIVFSELMRDVDLFVGVCSIGNDPNWQDGGRGYQDYWQGYSFGDLSATAITRKEVLARLLPRLKIASQCTLEDRFLVVEGKKRTYKIHLGSGNILMKPNDQYLCIVEGRGKKDADTKGLFLPFEGDHRMAVILSKAFMLAEDDKIKDATITSQINRR